MSSKSMSSKSMSSKRDPAKGRSSKSQSSKNKAETPVAASIQFQVPTAEVAKKLGVSAEELSEALEAGEVVVEYRKIGNGFRSSFTYDGRTAELEYTPVLKH